MKNNTSKKKGNNAKKLIPAAGMLAVSASMLATSTYAWFTMSREVEVKNIKLTASVPEDMQISLGKLSTADGSGHGYADNYGNLVKATGKTNANNGGVDAPGTVSEYWANTVDVSKYYALGTIMPASSTNGKAVFFTPDAAGVGKELKNNARFFTAVAADATTGTADVTPATEGKEYTGTFETTLHAFTGKTDGNAPASEWTPDLATAYNLTKDSGYYVDIPVWIRSAAKEDCYLAVDAYVTTNSTIDGDDLYLAARAVILNADKDATSGLLEIKPENFAATTSIVNFMSSTNASGEAVASVSGSTPTYGTENHYEGALINADADYKIAAAAAGSNYGEATKLWVRVWLEGEDPNCWNDNAGQDFNISLKFTKDRLYNAAAFGELTDAQKTAAGLSAANYPTKNAWTDVANSEANSLKEGDRVTVSGTITDANDSTGEATVTISMVYEYNGTTWSRISGSYPGKTVYVGPDAIANEAAMIAKIAADKTTKSSLSTAITFTETAS